MGRNKLMTCKLLFDESATINNKVLTMFSTENLINCFSEKNYIRYKKVINNANVQLILQDKELLDTISAFFECDLNITTASEKTYLHRNTLNYRLEKINKLLGLNLKSFEHAVVFKNLLIINDIITNYEKSLVNQQ